MWTRRKFLGTTGAAAAASALPVTARAAADKPNVLLVFPDQLRGQALSVYGETNIETPVFDGLLKGGAHFPRGYTVNPVCAPSRAALLTGLYPTRNGVIRNVERLQKQPTLGSLFKTAGYKCGYIGKWHLDGGEQHPGYVPHDRRHGFDDYWAAYNVNHKWKHSAYFLDDAIVQRPKPADLFEPIYQVDQAIQFMSTHGRSGTPFLLMMGFGPPHPPGTSPIYDWTEDVPKQYIDKVDKDAIELNPNVPNWIHGENQGRQGTARREPGCRHHLQGYYGSILALEVQIARLLAALDDLGLTKSTVVVVAADHGEMGGAHGMYKKGSPHEEAIRIPLGFRWPGTIKENQEADFAGVITDIVPTLCGLAGIEAPRTHGIDLSTWLLNGDKPERHNVMVQGKLGREDWWRMLRTPEWTYAEFPHQNKTVLWNSANDPFQLTDLGSDVNYEPVRRDLSEQLQALHGKVLPDTGEIPIRKTSGKKKKRKRRK